MPSERRLERRRWLRTHQVWCSFLFGTTWAILSASITIFIFGWDRVSLIFWLAGGWVFFGPLAVRGMVRSMGRDEPEEGPLSR